MKSMNIPDLAQKKFKANQLKKSGIKESGKDDRVSDHH